MSVIVYSQVSFYTRRCFSHVVLHGDAAIIHVTVTSFARKKPSDLSRSEVAALLVQAYTDTIGKVEHWSVFQEQHAQSQKLEERAVHYHAVVQTTAPCRWREVAAKLRGQGYFMSVSTASSRTSYWCAFAYCYAPSSPHLSPPSILFFTRLPSTRDLSFDVDLASDSFRFDS